MTRHLTLIAVLALSACGYESGAVTITNVYLPYNLDDYLTTLKTDPTATATCVLPKIDSLLMRSATGSADAEIPQLTVATFLQANLTPTTGLFVGGIELEGANTDQPILTQAVLSYSNAKVTDSTNGDPVSTVIRTRPVAKDMFLKFTIGSSLPSLSITGENLISFAANGGGGMAEQLAQVGRNEELNARALLEYRGHMSRTGAAISSGAIEFPIRMVGSGCVLKSKATGFCPAPGQFGGLPACCDGITPGTVPGC